MGEISNIIGGGTPQTNDPSNFGGNIAWITPADLSGYKGKTIRFGARNITNKGLEGSGARLLPIGTVLFSSRAPIGYVVVAAQDLTTSQGFKSFLPLSGISSDYVYYWLQLAKPFAEKLASGTTFLEISGAKSALIPVPLAPALEQTRIVEKLEEAFSDLDAGVAELKAAQKKLTQYRQSLLKRAVEGTLTAEWRDNRAKHDKPLETGVQLLKRILIERRQRWEEKQLAKFAEQDKTPPKDWKDKYPEPVQPDTSELPELPKGWRWATLDQCSADERAITDGPFGSNLKSSHYTDKGPRVIRLQNIGDGVFVDAQAHISAEHYEALKKHAVEEGDVVVAMLGETLPRACLIPHGVAPAIVKADCARIKVNKNLLVPELFSAFLNSLPIKKLVGRLVKGIGRPRINLSNLRAISVPIPPAQEQQEIINAITIGLLSIAEQEAAIILALRQSEAQRKNILKAAFSGQLIAQDPNDEPARVLLERIRAKREERTQQPRPRKARVSKQEVQILMRKLVDVLAEVGDWITAEEAFRRCGVTDGTSTERIEELYAELRELVKATPKLVQVEREENSDKLKLIAKVT